MTEKALVNTTTGEILTESKEKRFTQDQIDLLTRTVCKEATPDELKLFLHVAETNGLDPFIGEIFAVKRWDSKAQREVMAIQTGVQGLRKIAESTGVYAPGKEPTYTYDKEGKLLSATAYVKKYAHGQWHETSMTAHWAEYAQKKKDGSLGPMWAKMPHVMLAKCAESLALRRAFPRQFNGIYSREEMGQSENETTRPTPAMPAAKRLSALPAPVPAPTVPVDETRAGDVDDVPQDGTPSDESTSGIEFPEPKAQRSPEPLPPERPELGPRWRQLKALIRERQIDTTKLKWFSKNLFNKESSKELTEEQCGKLVELITTGAIK